MSDMPPSREALAATGRRVRLVTVAKTLRILITLVWALLLLLCTMSFLPTAVWQGIPSLTALALFLYAAIGLTTMRLTIVSGEQTAAAIVCGLFMLLPMAGVIFVFHAIMVASEVLRDNGVKVGFLGVSRRDVHRLRVSCCPGCGYSIAGITRGVCPECGATVAAASQTGASTPSVGT